MKASIILAAYNEEQHLREAIQSVAGQTHTDWELILVDDGSTDATAGIMHEAAEDDARIQIASVGRKLGKVHAFNTAYQLVSGDVVLLLGGDDRMADGALALRVAAVAQFGRDAKAVAFHKIRTFSTSKKFDGLVVPRGPYGNRSGPGFTLSRASADLAFPIPERLVAEDIWISEAAEAVSDHLQHGTEVVTHYRIHAGNSNPPHKTFADMSKAIHDRMEARRMILETDRFDVPHEQRRRLTSLMAVEDARYTGRLGRVMTTPGVSPQDRLANLAMGHPLLWGARRALFKSMTGWRGR